MSILSYQAFYKITILSVITSLILAGCTSSGSTDEPTSKPSDGSSENNAPTISGSPAPEATIGTPYSFRPTASDPDGDPLTFTAENLPSWATFNSATGAVDGTPLPGSEGTYESIQITVSDGALTASLEPFAIDVVQGSAGSALVSWLPPTTYTDNTALGGNLASYRIYYSTEPGTYSNMVSVSPGVTSAVIENLAPNTYYFVATAVDFEGLESGFSNIAIKTIN